MIPFSIEVRREDLPSLEQGEFYIEDILGCDVYDIESNKKIGVIDGFDDNGVQIVFFIRGEKNFDLPL